MDGFELPAIPPHVLHPETKKEDVNADELVSVWLSKLDKKLKAKSFSDLSELFLEDCWWRDMLALDWDFSSKHGQEAIAKHLTSSSSGISELKAAAVGGLKPLLVELPGMVWVQAGFSFKTIHGTGKGLLKLVNIGPNEWRAWSIFTQLEKLDYQNEIEARRSENPAARARRPQTNGVNGVNGISSSKAHEEDLQVLIVGAGQAGLSLGARLKNMGIKTLLVERHARVGDVWRKRYKSVSLNTPTYTDHAPYMKIPETWPRWLNGTQVADFWEAYSNMMGLDVTLGADVTSAEYDSSTRRYKVLVKRGEWMTTYSPRHVVLATGVFSDTPNVPKFPGTEDFRGQIYHSSQHVSAENVPDVHNKKVVVVGAATSGHDVSQDFVNHGAKEVSMIQRHPIFCLSAEASEAIQLILWNMEGLSTEEADLVGNATPLAVIRTMSVGMTHMMAEIDKDMIEKLRKAGLALNTGHDGFGLADYQLIKGGQYYVDQGASQMIIDGRIKVHRCDGGVEKFHRDGVKLSNGTTLDADIVVLSTGYHSSLQTVEKLMGSEVADKMSPRFGILDEENERAGWWRPTGQPGFWYMTGSFMFCRQYSLPLALQIAAIEKGLNQEHYHFRSHA